MNARQVLFGVVLALASGVGGYFAYDAARTSNKDTSVSATAALPDFSLPDIGGLLRQSSEWEGKVRVVNFWATWCPPCRREIPLLIQLQSEYGGDLQIIGIAIDDMQAVRDYAATTGFNYPVLVGQQEAVELGNQVLQDWIGLPFTAFVNSEGKVLRVHVGELHRQQADKFLREIF
jgi:thiol-disulfide isomerase/thioredoxin